MFKDKLKELVEKHYKSQKEIAEDLSLSSQRFNLYINGKRQPDFETLKLIANYFKVSIDYLLDNQDELTLAESDQLGKMLKEALNIQDSILFDKYGDLTQEAKDTIVQLVKNNAELLEAKIQVQRKER